MTSNMARLSVWAGMAADRRKPHTENGADKEFRECGKLEVEADVKGWLGGNSSASSRISKTIKGGNGGVQLNHPDQSTLRWVETIPISRRTDLKTCYYGFPRGNFFCHGQFPRSVRFVGVLARITVVRLRRLRLLRVFAWMTTNQTS